MNNHGNALRTWRRVKRQKEIERAPTAGWGGEKLSACGFSLCAFLVDDDTVINV